MRLGIPCQSPSVSRWIAVLALVGLAAGCGGGGDPQPDSLAAPVAEELGGSPCPQCREGVLSGVVFDGTPLAGAEVVVFDLLGATRRGLTDGQGHFEIDVRGLALSAPLLVQATGPAQGEPVRWHAPVRGTEVGKRSLLVSAMSELMTALALGGSPDAQRAAGRLDLMRLDAASIRAQEGRVEAALRPLLDAAGVPAAVDLRLSALPVDGQTGMARALGWLEVRPLGAAYRVRHVADAADTGWHLDPAAGGVDTGLPPLGAGVAARLQAAGAALPGMQVLMLRLEAALAASNGPDPAALRPLLAAGFHHQGLDATGYLERVLLRREAAAAGGRSLHRAYVGSPRVLEISANGSARIRFALEPREGETEPIAETMWAAPLAADGGWLLLGDGQAAAMRARPAAILGPSPLTEAEMRARSGVDCESWETLGCRIAGGSGDVPAGGHLALGAPGEAQFGVLGVFVSSDSDASRRWQQTREASRLFAAPSARIVDHVFFELDAWRVDPRAARAVVTGPGLPPEGLALVPPPLDLAGAARHWVLASAPAEDWAGVEVGWCAWTRDATTAAACREAWDTLRPGPARWTLRLHDATGALLREQAVALDGGHPVRGDTSARQSRFARFDLASLPGAMPSWANVLGWGHDGAALALSWPWRAGEQTRVLRAEIEWYRAPFGDTPAAADGSTLEVLRQRRALAPTDAALPLSVAMSSRPGWRGTWLVGRLIATDALGQRYIHFVAPANPQ